MFVKYVEQERSRPLGSSRNEVGDMAGPELLPLHLQDGESGGYQYPVQAVYPRGGRHLPPGSAGEVSAEYLRLIIH